MLANQSCRTVLFSAFVTIIAVLGGSEAAAQDLYITNARLLNVGARTETSQNILIRDGKIAGFPRSAPKDFTGRVVDVSGRWVMPALSDMHTHSVGNFLPPGGFQMM